MVRNRATNNSLSRSSIVRLGSNSRRVVNDLVGLTDRDDVYRVRLGDRSNLNVQLTGIQRGANINIQLFSLKGARAAVLRRIGSINFSNLRLPDIRRNLNRLGQSARAGRRNETLTRLLDSGEYYLRVFRGTGNSSYRLTFSTTPESSSPSPTPVPGGGTPSPSPTPVPGGGTPSPSPTPVPGGGTPSPSPGPTSLAPTWIRQLGTTANDYAYGVAVGSDLSVLVAGATFGNLQGNNAGGSDNFVVRYDSNGDSPVIRQFGTAAQETILDIEVDATGNYYVAGTLVSGSGQNTDVSGFVRKFNSAGTQLWNRQIDTTISVPFVGNVQTADGISSLALDANGNVYIAGFINGIPAGVVPLVSNPARAFVEKLDGSTGLSVTTFDTDGRAEFAASTGSAGSAGASGVAVDSEGNVYITGITNATLTADTNNPFTGGDAFVVKYNGTSGAQVWSQTLTSANNAQDYARGIAIAGSNVYITGLTAGTLPGQTNAGEVDGFLAQYTQANNGTTVSQGWVTQFGTSTLDESQGIATDSAGNIYITGETNASLFGGTHAGNSDAFIAKYDSTGARLASTQIGTTAADEAYGIRVDGSGNVYVVGQTQGNLGGTNQGNFDAWVAKYPAF